MHVLYPNIDTITLLFNNFNCISRYSYHIVFILEVKIYRYLVKALSPVVIRLPIYSLFKE